MSGSRERQYQEILLTMIQAVEALCSDRPDNTNVILTRNSMSELRRMIEASRRRDVRFA